MTINICIKNHYQIIFLYNDKEFEIKINNYILKITDLINNFHLNVVVANVYSIYSLFINSMESELSNECLKRQFINIMKILIPFIPHLAHECLEQLGETKMEEWPKVKNTSDFNEKIKIAIQINGKTREIIEIKKGLDQEMVVSLSKKNKKINDSLLDKKIIKIIFVENKIINYVIK